MQITLNAKIAFNSTTSPSCSANTSRRYETNKKFGRYKEMQDTCRNHTCYRGGWIIWPLGSDPYAQVPAVVCHPSECQMLIPGRRHWSPGGSDGMTMAGGPACQAILIDVIITLLLSQLIFLCVFTVQSAVSDMGEVMVQWALLCPLMQPTSGGITSNRCLLTSSPWLSIQFIIHGHSRVCATSLLLTSVVHMRNVLPCPAEELCLKRSNNWMDLLPGYWLICIFQESEWGPSQGSLYHVSLLITGKQFRFTENQTASAMNMTHRNQKTATYIQTND